MSIETAKKIDVTLNSKNVTSYAKSVAKEVKNEVLPAFYIGKTPYYNEMPLPPESRPRLTILDLGDPSVKEWVEDSVKVWNENPSNNRKKEIGWNEKGSSFVNPKLGEFKHGAVVEYDSEGNLTNYQYDLINWSDGRKDPTTKLPVGGSVIAATENVNGVLYVHARWQYRIASLDDIAIPENLDESKINDYIEANRGEWMLTVAGGFASENDSSAEATAQREQIEEQGIVSSDMYLTKKNFNRANVANSVYVGGSTFVRKSTPSNDNQELFKDDVCVRVDVFDSKDEMSNAAIHQVIKKNNLIKYTSE